MTMSKKDNLKQLISDLVIAAEQAQSQLDCGIDNRVLIAAETKRDALRKKIMDILDKW